MALVLSGKARSTVPSSQEEDDQLVRSSKKIKNGIKDKGDSLSRERWPQLGINAKGFQVGGPSFAEKLKGIDRNNRLTEDETDEGGDELSDDSLSESDHQDMEQDVEDPFCKTIEDPQRNFPTFCFSGKMKKRLYKAWRRAVIVKLLDRTIGYKALLSRLQTMWAKRGVVSLINIGHGYYVVKLSNRDVYFNALTGGPWMIYDHYLTVRPWEPNFKPGRATIDKVAVWVRMPNISLEYYDREALTFIGNRIRETIKVDMNTCQLRGHYARICVLVDLTKQLMSGFSLDGEDFYLEYEGLHSLCTNCGIYGHRNETCPDKKKTEHPPRTVDNTSATHCDEGKPSNHEEETRLQEVWHVVQKNRRQRKNLTGKGEGSRRDLSGSRFGVLADMEDTVHTEDSAPTYIHGGQQMVEHQTKQNQGTTVWTKAKRREIRGANHVKTAELEIVTKGIQLCGDSENIKDGQKRKEKRTRDMVRSEHKGGDNSIATKETSSEKQIEKGNSCANGKEDIMEMEEEEIQELDRAHHGNSPMKADRVEDNELDPGDHNNGLLITSPVTIEIEGEGTCEIAMVPETQFPLRSC